MADVSESTTYEDPAQAISTGKRHLLVRDFTAAVAALAQGCSLLAATHGDMADELGEPLLLYGRALLALSREESGVLGAGVPGSEEQEEPDEDEEEPEPEEDSDKDKNNEPKDTKACETKNEEKSETEKMKVEKSERVPAETVEGTAAHASKNEKAPASDSSKTVNGEASTSTALKNGVVHDNGEDDAEDLENEDEDDANNNLQLAWEILELSKLILTKRGLPGWKYLAETHRLLGELAMESGNQGGAITDLNACLEILKKIEPADPRSMAETHYQLGLAYSLGNDFDQSIEQFKEASNLLECRIKELANLTDVPKNDNPFYTIEGEIKELKQLLPEIQEKITDMRDFKQQACKAIIDTIKNTASGSCSNGAGPSGEGCSTSSSSKPASDISHLVRKKRKTGDEDSESASPCKKPVLEKSA